MRNAGRETGREILRHGVFAFLLAVLTLADQGIKGLVRGGIPERVLLPHVLGLTYVENRGMAFGLAQGKGGLLLVFSALAILVLGWMHLRLKGGKGGWLVLQEAGLLFTMAGALGNALDRLLYGYVADYLSFLFMDFPVFNLADILVVAGVGLLAVCLLWEEGA